MSTACLLSGKSIRTALYFRRVLVAKSLRSRPHPNLLHRILNRQVQKHLLDLHRYVE